MQVKDFARVCRLPDCERPVANPTFALSRLERTAREAGYCSIAHWKTGRG